MDGCVLPANGLDVARLLNKGLAPSGKPSSFSKGQLFSKLGNEAGEECWQGRWDA